MGPYNFHSLILILSGLGLQWLEAGFEFLV